MNISQFGASARRSPRNEPAETYRGKTAPCVICRSRAPWRIQPNICVDLGTHDVPDPSWLMGSSRSVVDDICPGAVGEGAIAGRGEGDAVGMPGIGPIVIRGAGAGVGDAELVGFGSALGGGERIGGPGMGAIVGAHAGDADEFPQAERAS